MKRKSLFIYLSILLLLCVSFNIQAQQYTLTDTDVVVTNGVITSCSYDFKITDIIIPETLDGQTVLAIYGEVVFGNKGITSVVLPSSLLSIGAYTFSENKLTAIDIPESVTYIGYGAFWYNEITRVKIPSKVTVIESQLFLGNVLISIELHEGITEIKEDAFRGNNLKTVKLPNSVQKIGKRAFSNNLITDFTFPEGIEKISDFMLAKNQLVNVTIPSMVTSVGEGAFQYNKISTLNLPEGLKYIQNKAFRGNALSTLDLRTKITKIGMASFSENPLLKSLILPVTVLENAAFIDWRDTDGSVHYANEVISDFEKGYIANFGYTLKDTDVEVVNGEITSCSYDFSANNIIIPNMLDGQVVIGIADGGYNSGVFADKNIQSIVLPLNLKHIGNYAFSANCLTVLRLPASIENIGSSAFSKNNIKELMLPNALKTMGTSAFSDNDIEHVTISENLVFIPKWAFHDNKLISLDLGLNVQRIGNASFASNKLTTVVLPNSVVRIDKYAFMDNPSLASMLLPTPQMENLDFLNWINGKGVAFTPKALVTDFTASYNALFKYVLTDEDVVVEKGVIESCSYSFEATSIVIPNYLEGQEVTGIGEGVFYKKNIVDVTLPSALLIIGNNAFSNNNLIHLVVPENVTLIGVNTFSSNQLISVILPNSLIEIKAHCFSYNYDLSSVRFSSSLESIGSYAFSYCYDLTKITIPETVTYIGESAFSGINFLSYFTLPSPVKTGYTLLNWLDGNNDVHEAGSSTSIKNTSYTAIFEVNNYLISGTVTGADAVLLTLSGDVNDSVTLNSGASYEFSIEYNKSVTLIAKKIGYHFETKKYEFPFILGDKLDTNFKATKSPNLYAPTIENISFSIDENSLNSEEVGTITLEDKDVLFDEYNVFSIIDKTGTFRIDSETGTISVLENTRLDFETIQYIDVTIVVNDYKHADVSKKITININDVNEVPSDIYLSSITIDDNVEIGAVFASLTTEDIDENQVFSYVIIENPYVALKEDKLQLKAALNWRQNPTITILITVKDQGGLSFKKGFAFTVKDVTAPVPVLSSLPDIIAECTATVIPPIALDRCVGEIKGTTTETLFYDVQGAYEIIWNYDDGRGNSTTQTQRIIIDDITAPEADEDLLTITGQFDVTLSTPAATDNCVGTLTATTSDPVHYDEIGTFTTTWVFDDGHGNTSSQTQTVIIGTSVESHGFSPNDDGINDTWTIDGIGTYKNCKVQVFSRSGVKVYEKNGYKNTWDGYSNTGSHKKMMSGVYYFIINFNKNGLEPKTGWLYINY